MEKKLRHHIIEALVLVALLVIFIPMIYSYRSVKVEVPFEKPPAFPASAADGAPQAKAVHSDASPAIAKPEAYVVQLGAFKNPEEASALLKQLQQKNFKAFLYKDTHDSKAQLKVFVGPETQREDAEKLLQELQQATSLQGKIILFNPLKL